MSDMFLTRSELEQLTGNKRSDAQARALNFMGIDHKIRPDGSVVVLRAYVEKLLGLKHESKKDKRPEDLMNWDALRK
jgi:hypothetical protein